MAVLRSTGVSAGSGGMVLDLGDLRREGEAVRARAKAQAEAMLAEARRERDRLIATAREDGLAEGRAAGHAEGVVRGHEEGLAERRSQLGSLEAAWKEALSGFLRDRENFLIEARADVLKLALEIAGRIVKHEVRARPELVGDQVRAVLAQVAGPTRVVLAVHPEDEALVRESLPGLLATMTQVEGATVVTDGALARGSCVARAAGGGVVDGSLDVQLDRIARVLLDVGGEA